MTQLPLRLHIVLSLLFTAIGVWIVVAPTAVGYQGFAQPWTQATYNDIAVGGLLVVGSIALLIAQVTSAVRARLHATRT